MKKSKKPEETQSMKCVRCEATCCRHIALEIDAPTTKREYDNIRWFLMHKDVSVYKDGDGKWTLEIATPCEFLGPDHTCQDYENRPQICSDYPNEGTICEFEGDNEEKSRSVHFSNAKSFEEYLDRKKKKWRFKTR